MSTPRPEPIQLLEHNQEWAAGILIKDPEFFKEGVRNHSPKILWIGCADSRCPESVITSALPGDIFVQRNIANQVHLDDPNATSLIQFTVERVGIRHIVVTGHTHCGGIKTCYAIAYEGAPPPPPESPLGKFIDPLLKLAISLDLKGVPKDEALAQLTKENVAVQVRNVVETLSMVEHGNEVAVYGWLYKTEEGLLEDLRSH